MARNNTITTVQSPLATTHPERSPHFPETLLPPPLRAVVDGITETTLAPIEYTVTACLGIASAALSRGVAIRDGTRLHRANLFFLVESHPDYTPAFEAARHSLAALQDMYVLNWRHCALPTIQVTRAMLRQNRPTLKNRTDPEATNFREWRDYCNELTELRNQERNQPLYYLNTPLHPRLLQRLAHQPNATISFITQDPRDVAPLFENHHPSTTASLANRILLAGYQGTPLSHLTPSGTALNLSKPSTTLLAPLNPEIYTPQNLKSNPLLPTFLPCPTSLKTCPNHPTNPPHDSYSFSCSCSCSKAPNDQPQTKNQEPGTKNAFPPLPLHLPTPNHTTHLTWRQILKTFLSMSRGDLYRTITPSPGAQKILRTYENECRHLASTTMADVPEYPLHWAQNAWRLALLLHSIEEHTAFEATITKTPEEDPSDQPTTQRALISDRDLPQISPATATAAVALMRWYATQIEQLIAPARARLTLHQNPRLAKLIQRLETAGGTLTLGQLNHSNKITAEEVHTLATTHPHLLQVTTHTPDSSRPYTTVTLRDPHHPSRRQCIKCIKCIKPR